MIHNHSERNLPAEVADVAHERGAFLITEDDRNTWEILERPDGSCAHLDAAWADDFLRQLRVAMTREKEAYFKNYEGTAEDLAQTVTQVWFFRGQPCPSWHGRWGTEDDRDAVFRIAVLKAKNSRRENQ